MSSQLADWLEPAAGRGPARGRGLEGLLGQQGTCLGTDRPGYGAFSSLQQDQELDRNCPVSGRAHAHHTGVLEAQLRSRPPWAGSSRTRTWEPPQSLLLRHLTDLLSSQMRTALPEATYNMVPEGLRAIWLIWCSPWALVIARVDVAAQASPEITWPEDLPTRKRGKTRSQDGPFQWARKLIKPHSDQS